MSALHIILDCLLSLCQKLSELVEITGSYDKKQFCLFFSETMCKYFFRSCTRVLQLYMSVLVSLYDVDASSTHTENLTILENGFDHRCVLCCQCFYGSLAVRLTYVLYVGMLLLLYVI